MDQRRPDAHRCGPAFARAFWEEPWASYPNEQLRVSSRSADVAHHGCRIVRKYAGHRQKVADVPVDDTEQRDDCGLVRGDRKNSVTGDRRGYDKPRLRIDFAIKPCA